MQKKKSLSATDTPTKRALGFPGEGGMCKSMPAEQMGPERTKLHVPTQAPGRSEAEMGVNENARKGRDEWSGLWRAAFGEDGPVAGQRAWWGEGRAVRERQK